MKKAALFVLTALLFCLAGCAAGEGPGEPIPCRVVLEEGEGFTARSYAAQTAPGGELRFSIRPEDGYTVSGADYQGCAIVREPGGGMTLVLPEVRYSTAVRLEVERSGTALSCHANGGTRLDGGDPARPVDVPVTPSHLRLNTCVGTDLFQRPGYTLTGWNTAPDGSGTAVGLGSRAEPAQGLVLYAQWVRWTAPALFRWEPFGDGAAVTGYTGAEVTLVVPGELGGLPVRCVRAGAFAGANCEAVILPDTLRTLENGAFDRCALRELTLFDSLRTVSDYSFSNCENLRTLRVNAALPPVYSGSYYASFADKFDRLLSLENRRKIVLFSGSSARFGYDSKQIDAAFPGYDVVNMGVFAYTNALPQLELILTCMGEGDVLVHSPEFDAAQRQFCTSASLDAPFFNLMEANYDMVSLLDLREYGQVFTAFAAYLDSREGMEPRSYALSPADFDEEGNPADTPSYNRYGDYIRYRPNAPDEAPVYGLPVDYTVRAFPKSAFLDPLNGEYRRFLDKGVQVYFTYAPRNRLAVSEDSTHQARRELDAWLRENLCVPVLGDMEASLVSGTYLYGTDNHLSTQGVELRTAEIIAALAARLGEGAEP